MIMRFFINLLILIENQNKEIIALEDLISEFLGEKVLKAENSDLLVHKISFEKRSKLKFLKIMTSFLKIKAS